MPSSHGRLMRRIFPSRSVMAIASGDRECRRNRLRNKIGTTADAVAASDCDAVIRKETKELPPLIRPSEAQGVRSVATAREAGPSAQLEVGPARAAPRGLEHLTPRQIEGLRLGGRGLTNAQDHEKLFPQRPTAHRHLGFIFD